jgi:hypothetical protein
MPYSLIGAEDLRCPVSPGSEEHQANRRLNGGALAEAVGWLEEAGVQAPDSPVWVSTSPCLSVKVISLFILTRLFTAQPQAQGGARGSDSRQGSQVWRHPDDADACR